MVKIGVVGRMSEGELQHLDSSHSGNLLENRVEDQSHISIDESSNKDLTSARHPPIDLPAAF